MSTSGKRNALVYYRIFPMTDTEWDLVKIEDSTIYIRHIQDLSKNSKLSKYWECKSNGIFNNKSQEFVYTHIIEGVLERIIEGFNGIILAFGQIGTGKSFTLGGLQFSEEEFGIAPRVILDLFKIKNELPKNIKMIMHMSYTEFSKLGVVDLLKELPNSIDPWHVKNATKIKIKSEYEALKLLFKGEGRKLFANNNVHRYIMSHIGSSVLTFHITTANQDFSCPEKISSRLHIIDMAGVDSVDNSSSNFKNPIDVGNANLIKSYMEQFILNLMHNIPRNNQVKERTNPLIYFLGCDLNNESILRFIGHIKIKKEDFKITTSTLRFGQLVTGLKPKVKHIEPEINEHLKLQYLLNKIETLQNEKIYNSVLMNQDLTLDLNQDRIEHIQATIDAYLHNRISEVNILNVAEASEVFKIFKSLCNVTDDDKGIKIQQDPESNKLGKRGSRTGSKTSLKNIKSLGKRLKRSRDSMPTVDKPRPVEISHSKGSVRTKSVIINRSPTNLVTSQSSVTQYVKPTRSNSASLAKQASVSISRKSGSSSTKDRRESKKELSDPGLIPDAIPKFETAWNAFINDSKSAYKTLYAPYKQNENEIKTAYTNYQYEMKKLQTCKEIVNKRESEMLEAKMYQQFIISSGSDNILADTEPTCQENLTHAESALLEQQEVVLKAQSELKMLLNNRRNLKQNLQEDFDQYCKDNYNVTIPILDNEVGEDQELVIKNEILNAEDQGSDEQVEEEQQKCFEKHTETIRLEKLKNIMKREIRKNLKLRELKNRKWKNVF